MVQDVKNMVASCDKCATFAPSQQREPLILTKGSFPFEKAGVDLFHANGKNYMVLVDSFSGFPWVAKLSSTTTAAVTSQLRRWFADFGYPKHLRSDGGPQFRTEFADFCERLGITRELASPYNATSNGLAESGVKQMKYLLLKSTNEQQFRDSLLVWRNTPRQDGLSPAQLFFGFTQNFGQSIDYAPEYLDRKVARKTRLDSHDKVKTQFDKASVARDGIPPGSIVRIQDPKTKRWSSTGVVESVRDDTRSYSIICDDGTAILRNRRFIKLKSA